jgi:hypothetical protein
MVDNQNSEGNVSLNNVEKFDFKGHEVTYGKNSEGKDVVVTPDGLTEDETKEFVSQVPSLLASLNKKGFTLNRELEELELKKRELDLREKELMLKANSQEPKQTQSLTIMSILGVADKDDLAELMVSDPDRYAEGLATLAEYKSNAKYEVSLRQNTIENQIAISGYNPEEVKAFMRSHSIGDLNSAFSLFKTLNAKAENPSMNVRRNVQADAPDILPAGSLTKKPKAEDTLLNKWGSIRLDTAD